MSEAKSGGPAFPRAAFSPAGFDDGVDAAEAQEGMTLREYYAGQILAGIHASVVHGYPDDKDAAKRAVAAADALIEALRS